MKKFMMTIAILLISVISIAQKTISFTPHSVVSVKEVNGKYYNNEDWNKNTDNIKSLMTFMQWAGLPVRYVLAKPGAKQTVHFTQISQAGVSTASKYAGLNYVVLAGSSKMIYISENATEIKAQLETWKAGDISQPVVAQTKLTYNVGQEFVVGLYANESFTITLPPFVQFLGLVMTNQWGYQGRTWTKFFDYNYTIENNILMVNITPGNFMFYNSPKTGEESFPIPLELLGNPEFSMDNPVYNSSGNRLGMLYYKGYRTLGGINLKAIAPGDAYILGAQEGYLYVK